MTPLEQLRDLLEERDLDGLVLNSYQAVTHFAGIHLLSQLLLPDRLAFLVVTRRSDGVRLVVCNIEARQARAQSGLESVVEYVEFAESPAQALSAAFDELGLERGRVAFEARRMPVDTHRAISQMKPDIAWVDADDAFEALQTVKGTEHLASLRSGAVSTQEAIEEAVRRARPSDTEADICGAIVAGLARAGGTPVFCFFGSGAEALNGHPEPARRAPEAGKVWRTDVGGRFGDGIMSDVARTGVYGAPTAEQVATFDVVASAQRAGLRALRPGARARDVYYAVRQTFREAGFTWDIPHVGHGLGVGVHEEPIFAPGNHTVLREGMVINVEPILLLHERGEAYHTEDLATVTADGVRLLTTPQERLLVIAR